MDFPRIMAPAALSFFAIAESRGTLAPTSDQDPAAKLVKSHWQIVPKDHSIPVLFILSIVAMLFLMMMGTPCKGLNKVSKPPRRNTVKVNVPSDFTTAPLCIQRCSDVECVRVGFCYRV